MHAHSHHRSHDHNQPLSLPPFFPSSRVLQRVTTVSSSPQFISTVVLPPSSLSSCPSSVRLCPCPITRFPSPASHFCLFFSLPSLPFPFFLLFPLPFFHSLTFLVGEYSCARVKISLKREYSYYLIQLYIPCIMLVVVSWVSFWLDKDAVPARVSLGVTTLLTMTTQASGINSKLPPVSYIKAVDVWIGVCLAFIFGALLEYAVVNYYGRKEFLRNQEKSKKLTRMDDCACPGDRPALRLDLSSYRKKTWSPRLPAWFSIIGKTKELSRKVDLISRITFPTLFTAFLIFYYFFYVVEYIPDEKNSK